MSGPNCCRDRKRRQIAEAAHLADGWLAREVRGQTLRAVLPSARGRVPAARPLPSESPGGVGGTTAALQLIPELEVNVLDAGCCGMAGSFGFERGHYDLSVKIANLALLPELASSPRRS